MTERGDWADYLAGEISGLDIADDERSALDRIGRHLGDEALWEAPASDGQFRLLAAAAAEAGQLSDLDGGSADGSASDPPIPPVASPPRPEVDRDGGPAHQPKAVDDGDDYGDDEDGVIRLLDRRRGRRQRAGWFGAGAVAAAAAAVLVLVGTGQLPDDSDDSMESALTVVATYELTATELDPDTVATIDVAPTPSGVEFWLHLQGLDNTDGDDYYAAWLVSDDDAVPLGSFHWRAGGVDIILWSGVDDPAYDRIVVTRQVQGDGGIRSDEVVLMGEVPVLTADPDPDPDG